MPALGCHDQRSPPGRRRGRRRRRHHRRLVRVVPPPRRPRAGRAARGGHARQGREQPRRRHGARAGRHRDAVRLGMFSRDFYAAPARRAGRSTPGSSRRATSCRASPRAEVEQAHARIAMQRALGLDVRWLGPDEFDQLNPAMAPGHTLGASYAPGTATSTRRATCSPTRRRWSPPASRSASGRRSPACDRGRPGDGRRARRAGEIATDRVVLTGGPQLAEVGAAAGARVPAGGARHQVVVTEPHPDLAAGAAADGVRRRRRASTGARRRAACSGG